MEKLSNIAIILINNKSNNHNLLMGFCLKICNTEINYEYYFKENTWEKLVAKSV
jgi:hypothetical protein